MPNPFSRTPVRPRDLVLYVVLCLNLLPGGVAAQAREISPTYTSLVDRSGLHAIVDSLDLVLSSPASPQEARLAAEGDVEVVRRRLTRGDFEAGDQIQLEVEGEAPLTDTFIVGQGQTIRLPMIGEISLAGILRSELEEHLTRHLARFIIEPDVRARSLTRIAVLGEVGEPGYYLVPSELQITDAIMLAGGPSAEARIEKMRVRRGDEEIWAGKTLAEALAMGQTLDQMNLVAGDQVVVPGNQPGAAMSFLRNVATTLPPLVMLLLAVTNAR